MANLLKKVQKEKDAKSYNSIKTGASVQYGNLLTKDEVYSTLEDTEINETHSVLILDEEPSMMTALEMIYTTITIIKFLFSLFLSFKCSFLLKRSIRENSLMLLFLKFR